MKAKTKVPVPWGARGSPQRPTRFPGGGRAPRMRPAGGPASARRRPAAVAKWRQGARWRHDGGGVEAARHRGRWVPGGERGRRGRAGTGGASCVRSAGAVPPAGPARGSPGGRAPPRAPLWLFIPPPGNEVGASRRGVAGVVLPGSCGRSGAAVPVPVAGRLLSRCHVKRQWGHPAVTRSAQSLPRALRWRRSVLWCGF